jgi:L,D-peptidoglycan transpeptidase YkuD (ErfK/YbiS/YcfS/YnhG family)
MAPAFTTIVTWKVAVGIGAASAFTLALFALPEPNTATKCMAKATGVEVDSATHTLLLCEGGEARGRYHVRIGKAGVGKTKEGDNKTPLGAYTLGAPRVSTSFGEFIPVGYPRADQQAKGYTGTSVGIHGPSRTARPLGRLANAFDTTRGCIGLAKDEEVGEIGKWLEKHKGAGVIIR